MRWAIVRELRAGTQLSMPEMILLRRVLKKPLITTYVAVVATGILATGYLFNLVV